MSEPTTTEHVVLLRDWPGLDSWAAPTAPPSEVPRLWQRNALVLHVAARRGAVPECFGLGVALVVLGRSVLGGCLVTPDDLAVTDPAALAAIVRWTEDNPLGATARPWQVVTRSAFFDPFATVETAPWAFQPNAYSGAGYIVGADLGRTFGLSAEHCARANRDRRAAWTLWLPGWGHDPDGEGWERRSPHRPPLRVRARRVGWQVEFGPCGTGADSKPAGKIHRGRVWRGAFVDLLSLAYGLDADRGANFAEHREDFALAPAELPLSVTVDAAGAAEMAEAAHALHGLALALDDEAGHWFTTPQDRRERRGRVDLVRTTSPAALAAQIPARFGLRAPLGAVRIDDEEHRRWAEAFHGGWCEAHPRLVGTPVPAVSADVSSCYPLMAHRLDWWDLACAEGVRRDEVTEALRQICRRATCDPSAVLEPDLWRRFGATLVEVAPDGERFPVAVEDRRRPDGRLDVAPLRSPERPMFYAWPDVVAAAVLSGRSPRIVSAIRYTPVGRQKVRRRLPLLPGVVLHAERDPVIALVRHRRKLKRSGDYRLAAQLRVVANALVYGNPSRFDDVWRYDRRTRRTGHGERPGPWCFLPIASSVAAGARLLLAALDRQVTDLGGVVAYRDTDSAVIPATPEGGSLDLADGCSLRALSWVEVDDVLGTFAPLSPGPDWPVWTTERDRDGTPLSAMVFGPKRHAAYGGGQLLAPALDAEGEPELADATEANLGGTYADPPALRGRVQPVDGYRRWSMAAVVRELRYAEVRASNADALRPGASWDSRALRAPALRRYIARTPAMVAALPSCLRARPGTRYVVGEVDELRRGHDPTPVALDPGGDLADWQLLGWVDMASGEPLTVTTDGIADLDAVLLGTLDSKGVAWGRPRRERVEPVAVDPLRVRRVGRVSGVLDAADDAEPGDPEEHWPAYRRCACGCGAPLERGRGARYIDDDHRRAARNARRRQPKTARLCECPCRRPLPPGRKDRRFLSDSHRKAAARATTHEQRSTR